MNDLNQSTTIKDMFGNVIRIGEPLVLLLKEYGYRKMTNASLDVVIYRGYDKSARCHKFDYNGYIVQKRTFSCVRISKKQYESYLGITSYTVHYWDDRRDESVYSLVIKAKSESEAEELFLKKTANTDNDFSDTYPVLVEEN